MAPENLQFKALMTAAGWSQAETARQLDLSTGAISQIYNGQIRPSAQTLRLFKLVLAAAQPERLSAGVELHDAPADEIALLAQRVRNLPPKYQKRVSGIIKEVLGLLPNRPVSYRERIPSKAQKAQ